MGPKSKQRKDNYWDSDQADKDREDALKLNGGSDSEDDTPKRATSKFAPMSDESESESEESSSEEEKPVKKQPNKPAAKSNKKAPASKGGKKVVESSSEESEEESSEESSEEEKPVKKQPNKPAAKQQKKSAPAKGGKKVVESSSEESESEEESSEESSSEEEKPVKKQPNKPAAKSNKKAPANKGGKKVESSSEESESEEESSSEEEPVKKQPAKPAPANNKKNNTSKKAAAKPAPAQSKKSAASSKEEPEKLSGFLLKQRQEEERKEREKEEKRIREEEAKRVAEEKRIIEEEKAKAKAAENAKKRAEKKEKQQEESKEQERMAKLAKLGININNLGANEPKKPAANKNKKQQQKADELAKKLEEVKIEEEPKADVVEVMDSWDNDDYETIDEIQKKRDEELLRKQQEEEALRLAAKEAKKKAKAEALNNQIQSVQTDPTSTIENKSYRSPIICILGHVDTGKTSLLDRIRNTNVQGGEARGITQQIGASFIPVDAIKEQTKTFAEKLKMDFKLPGLLLIDTPGHESFNNLRSRGSGLCDLAILVIDIMHGLEAQTIESINLLRMRKTPFIVALNKVDRIYDWKPCVNTDFKESYKLQTRAAAQEFDSKVKETIAALAGQELNAELYWRNKDHKKYVSLVPTSAHTGEGLSDLMLVVIQLMQKLMIDKVEFSNSLQCTVLEVKVIEGYGTTIDVVLVNGTLNEGDKIIVSGFNGPIETNVRSLLTPPPLRESRVKSQFIQHKSIRAAMGIKIVAPGLEKAVPGTSLHVVGPHDDIDKIKAEAKREVDSVLNDVETSGIGVSVQASTLGSLEAFLSFLKKIKIPVANVAIGPVHKKHVMNTAIMLDKDPKYAILLAFDVKIEDSAIQAANEMKIQILSDETIYLFEEKLKKHFGAIKDKLRAETAGICVWPCILEVIQVFRNTNPIICGVKVREGTLRIGTPICVPESNSADVGVVTSIKLNEKDVQLAKKDDVVSIAIDDQNTKTTLGRHYDDKKQWMSKITRESLDALKEAWAEDLSKQDIQLLKFMKQIYKIQ